LGDDLLYIQVPKNNWKGEMSGLEEKFSKILVAIDGSRPSMDAVYYAIAIAQGNEAEFRWKGMKLQAIL